VPLTATDNGLPCVIGATLISGLSYTERWVAIAVGASAAVGVDIESITPPAPRESTLLRHWARKEATLRACATPPADTASSGPHGTAMLPLPQGRSHCVVKDLDVAEGVVCAVAMPLEVERLGIFVLDNTGASRR